jgi:hypothetical protein
MVVKVELPPLSPDTEATEQDDKPYDDNLSEEGKFEDLTEEKPLEK